MCIRDSVCFVELSVTPAWCVIVVIARELMVTSIRLVAAGKGSVVAANLWGKVKTVGQITAILGIMLLQYLEELHTMGVSLGIFTAPIALEQVYPAISGILILCMTVLTLVSGVVYLRQNWDVVKTAK